MTTTDLVELAHSLNLEALEQAWNAALSDPGPVESYRKVIETLCDADAAGTALSLGSTMVDALASKGRPRCAVDLASALIRHGAHNDGLNKRVFEILQEQHGAEEWYELLLSRAELTATAIHPDGITRLVRLLGYTPGNVVFHAAGWGEGTVEGFDATREEARVRFAGGREEDFPFATLLDSFKALPHDDLRSMRLLAKDELEHMAAENPGGLIRKAAELYRGRIKSSEVKKELTPSVIPKNKWNSFWKRAKAAAAHDPWLQVDGSTTRPVFLLRKKPLGLVEEARKALTHADDLGSSIAILRDYLERTKDEALRHELMDMAEEIIERALQEKKESPAFILDGILMLEEQGRKASVSAAQELQALLLADDGALLPQNLNELATQEARVHAVLLLPEALGEQWVDKVIETLTDFPSSTVENTVDLLHDQHQGHRLLDLWSQIAPYPRRHPFLTYFLCRMHSDGAFDDREDRPEDLAVARVALHLARVLTDQRRGNTALARVLNRTTSLLSGRREFLKRALQGIKRDDLATILGITERGGADFPQEITAIVLREVSTRFPDLTKKPDKPFWETESLFVTADGLARQREEYRLLVDIKIPENSKAIGAAASLGDLSENSEWESAMEEQRNLTTRAAEMDKSLRIAKVIEHQQIPDGVVAPGVKVALAPVDGGPAMDLRILGPWDCIEDGIINYMASLAQALLGRKLGEQATIPTETGETQVVVQSIEKIV